MELQFVSHGRCDACSLCQTATCRGIPARPSDLPKARNAQALLIVGEAPGYHEDRRGRCWIGKSGQLLHKLLMKASLHTAADIYLTNAVRCLPPRGVKVNTSPIKKCKAHLLADIQTLADAYSGRLTLLATGAVAVRSLLEESLADAFEHQGYPLLMESGGTTCRLPVYATYHPAILLGKKPSLLFTIRDHLYLLYRKLSGIDAAAALPDVAYTIATEPPDHRRTDGRLSLDIETYGALAAYEQTAFHPAKSLLIDKVSPDQLIQTVALAYRLDGVEQSVVFDYTNPAHRLCLYRWLEWAAAHDLVLVGQNLPFDLQYLRFVSSILAVGPLRPFRLKLREIIVRNFLHSENRPERSLKSLARLFALASYKANNFQASGPLDPALLSYNALDALVNLRADDLLTAAIAESYGPGTPKNTPICHDHVSDLTWTLILMSEAGLPFDLDQLEQVESRRQHLMDLSIAIAHRKLDLTLCGKGSKNSILGLVIHGVDQAGLSNHPNLELTEAKKEISTSDANITLILNHLDRSQHPRTFLGLKLLSIYRGHAKIVQAYTHPILHDPHKGICTTRTVGSRRIGLSYPTWYPCPSKHDNDSDKSGGTIQGRITCRHPAYQTAPADIRNARTSRFPDGVIIHADLSQIELRVAALLSGDPILLDEFARNVDPHDSTGSLLFVVCTGGQIEVYWTTRRPAEPRETFRQMGKTTNFLILFEGQADKLQETIHRDVKYLITLQQAQNFIDTYNAKYHYLRGWQRSLIATAIAKGFLQLPSGWSRTFLGGRKMIEGPDANKVLNFPVQTTAAQLLQSATAAIFKEIARDHNPYAPRFYLDMNVYDALDIDAPAPLVPYIRDLLSRHLPHPPYLRVLEDQLGRSVPIKYDIQIKHPRTH